MKINIDIEEKHSRGKKQLVRQFINEENLKKLTKLDVAN